MKRIASLPILLLNASVCLAGNCSHEWICIDARESDTTVEFLAQNLKPWPLTVTLRVEASGVPVRPQSVVTRTVWPRETVTLSTVTGGTATPRYRYYWDWTPGDTDARHDADYLYRPPYATGHSYRVLQGFGSRFSHKGLEYYAVDFDMPVGTPVHAAREGIVVMVEESHERGCWERSCSRHANYVVVLHADGTTGEYYHLDHDGVLVEPGSRVARGELIGRSGNTGRTTMPHLHFAVYRATTWGRTQSLPLRFVTADGVVAQTRRGMRLVAGE